ncbi:hypothetical protein [Roseovarius sp. EL26]|uniref:hypothetical protein n=1 Tax=Roseovarius sp. EL26 TaxID=2126672 RepID=UPI000EA05D52|nr:hypothetical protein [Roseovarius sp. EL26]
MGRLLIYALVLTSIAGAAIGCIAPDAHRYFLFESAEKIENPGEFVAKVEVLSFVPAEYEITGDVLINGKKYPRRKLVQPASLAFKVIEFVRGHHSGNEFESELQFNSCTGLKEVASGRVAYVSGDIEDEQLIVKDFRRKRENNEEGLY